MCVVKRIKASNSEEAPVKRRWLQVVVSIALLLSVAWLVPAQAQEAETPEDEISQPRTVSVSGTGQSSTRPDLAVVVLGVEVQAKEASEALSENSQRMQAVIDALVEEGVAARDIQTQAIRLSPQYEQPAPSEPGASQGGATELVGFMAVNVAEVQVRDLENLGVLLDVAVQAGGNRIQGIRFQVEKAAELYDQARRAAWTDALHKAEQLAELAGEELGPALTINESSHTPLPVVEQAALGVARSSVPIEPGNQLVQVDLQITWQLTSSSQEVEEESGSE
jgi:uncharacterized protein YggE